jgi:hypothetical protein
MRYPLLAWLKMRIEEINSAMTNGESEAWCAGFAIVNATKRTSCQNPPDCVAGQAVRKPEQISSGRPADLRSALPPKALDGLRPMAVFVRRVGLSRKRTFRAVLRRRERAQASHSGRPNRFLKAVIWGTALSMIRR